VTKFSIVVVNHKIPRPVLLAAVSVLLLICDAGPACSEPPAPPAVKSFPSGSASGSRISLEAARDRAEILHDYSLAMLEMMHHRYFHNEKAMIPARAMEDVFDELKTKWGAELRWISGNMDAMNISHEPKTDFEHQAVKEFKSGKTRLEAIEGGFLRHAGIVPLQSDCVSCHAGFFKATTKTPKFAGLMISIPIVAERAASIHAPSP